MTTSLRDSCFGTHDFLYCIQPCRICDLVLIRELLQEHAIDTLGKKHLSIFTDRSMISDQSSNVYIQQIGEAKMFQPGSIFQIGRMNGVAVIVI